MSATVRQSVGDFIAYVSAYSSPAGNLYGLTLNSDNLSYTLTQNPTGLNNNGKAATPVTWISKLVWVAQSGGQARTDQNPNGDAVLIYPGTLQSGGDVKTVNAGLFVQSLP